LLFVAVLGGGDVIENNKLGLDANDKVSVDKEIGIDDIDDDNGNKLER
jgi:hypothetical protein